MGQKRGLKIILHRHKDKTKEIANLNEQLDLLSLRIVPVTADGNCFFRAVAEQLEGDEEQHAKYRQLVVDYLQEHREEFEPFVEDEVPFDEYCKTMREDGTWAGHMELQASSLVNHCNICIHQLMTPRWHIRNFESTDATTIHLSYHDGEHYNSVRRQDDIGVGPAKPITIEGDATPTTKPPPAKDSVRDRNKDMEEAALKTIMAGSGCTNMDRMREVLRDVHGDTYAAIEYLIAESSGEISPACSCDSDPSSSGASETGEQNSSHRTSVSDEGESITSQASDLATENGGLASLANGSAISFQVICTSFSVDVQAQREASGWLMLFKLSSLVSMARPFFSLQGRAPADINELCTASVQEALGLFEIIVKEQPGIKPARAAPNGSTNLAVAHPKQSPPSLLSQAVQEVSWRLSYASGPSWPETLLLIFLMSFAWGPIWAEEVVSNKIRKQKLKITKGLHHTNEPEHNHPPEGLNMGALCI